MIYAYCRISRPTQNITRQERNILELYPTAKLFTEAFSGTTQDRPMWQKLIKTVKESDTIVFDSVSRMSRNAEEGFKDYEELYNRGVNLIFIKEPHINSDTYKSAQKNQLELTNNEIADIYITATNEVLLLLAKQQIKIAFDQAQKEVDDLHQRVSEGIKTAKLNGKQIGRANGTEVITKKSIASKDIIRKHSRSFGGTLSDKDCIKLCGISRNSFYKYKSEIAKE